MSNKIVISLEGLIGAGKTTTIERIKNDNVIKCVEPLHYYTHFVYDNNEFNPLQQLYLYNGEKNQVATQLHIINCMKKWYNDIEWRKNNKFLLERTIESVTYFIETMYQLEMITAFEKYTLLYHMKNTKQEIKNNNNYFPLTHVCLINTPISKCINHIAIRDRFYETCFSSIDEYLKELRDKLNIYINVQECILGKANVFRFDWHPDIHKDIANVIDSI